MPTDARRLFVQLIKQACEKYLADGDYGILGHDYDFRIDSIEPLPAGEPVKYSYHQRRDDGSYEEIVRSTQPFEFRVRYWDECGDTSSPEETLSMAGVIEKVGSMISGQVDTVKACNAIEWLRREAT